MAEYLVWIELEKIEGDDIEPMFVPFPPVAKFEDYDDAITFISKLQEEE